MSSLETPRPIRTDSTSGISVVYEISGPMLYQLVTVPTDRDYTIQYTKPSFGIDLELASISGIIDYLSLSGEFDADIIQLLGLNVFEKRRGPNPPLLSVENIKELEDYEIYPVSDTPGLFEADGVILGVSGVYRFLQGIWQPQYRDSNNPPPQIYLGDNQSVNSYDGVRVLPQKIPLRSRRDWSRLLIR